MALPEIIGRIREDAAAEADRLRADGESRVEAMLAAARREAARRREALLEREAAALAEVSRNRLAGARLAARGRVLELRRSLLEETFAAGTEAARGAERGGYAAWLGARVAGVPEPEGVEIELGRGDLERFGPALGAAVAREAGVRRPQLRVLVRETPGRFEAGVAVHGAASVHDFSLESVVRERRERWEVEVAKVLFRP